MGMIGGLVIAEVIAYSLIEISVAFPFAIMCGIGFCLLGLALGWRIWVSIENKLMKAFFLLFALVVFGSGVSCFFLQQNWSRHYDISLKIPIYGALGMSFAFCLTFTFSEILALAPCDRCCKTNLAENPIFGTAKQLIILFVSTLNLGLGFGILFGLTDVGGEDHLFTSLKNNALISIPFGVAVGGAVGLVNQYLRNKKSVGYEEVNGDGNDGL
eukprot:TRINITY_DN7423_c0_g1_i1.p1 TRINITY_DN7423_c0_g1~~TRINITY_DN7423_c0_g1_i1.p1  ORF type:complete len:239 (-),score=42.92 TRINITY_DN7423_c0_g1_i1:104-745(-)